MTCFARRSKDFNPPSLCGRRSSDAPTTPPPPPPPQEEEPEEEEPPPELQRLPVPAGGLVPPLVVHVEVAQLHARPDVSGVPLGQGLQQRGIGTVAHDEGV